jgi:hypothetical protein
LFFYFLSQSTIKDKNIQREISKEEHETDKIMAGWKGLEPSASDVTGRRYNQLNYHPALCAV